MLITLKGLVIGQRIIGENSCFLDLFTDKLGMIEVMAHGAKKIGGKNSGAASLFSYATFCVSRSSKGYTLNSAEPICSFYNISADIEALSLAAYFADIIKYCATSEEEHSDLLRFTSMTYFQLEKQKLPLRFIKAIFEFRFLSRIGFMPDLRACRECIAYQSDTMMFLPVEGVIYCLDCYEEHTELLEKNAFALNHTLLHTLRYVAYSDTDKMYRFRISKENEKLFSAIAEFYLLSQLNRSFPTLDYYKNIVIET